MTSLHTHTFFFPVFPSLISSHAGLLERIHESLQRHIPTRNFNITVASYWLWLTASPPIIQIPILAKFFDGNEQQPFSYQLLYKVLLVCLRLCVYIHESTKCTI